MVQALHNLTKYKTPGRLATALLVVLLITAAGCQLIAYPFIAFKDYSTPALYKIEDRRTLILVDDPSNLLNDPVVLNQIAENMAFHFTENDVITDIVPREDLLDLEHQKGKDFRQMAVHSVGETLKAEQVIHVEMRQFIASTDSSAEPPAGTAWVRVWDVTAHKRLFPTEGEYALSEGYLLTAKMRPSPLKRANRLARATLVREFASFLAEEAAGLFYKRVNPGPGHLQDEIK